MRSGAKFVRADPHTHSFGEEVSYDITDSSMTPENILDSVLNMNITALLNNRHKH